MTDDIITSTPLRVMKPPSKAVDKTITGTEIKSIGKARQDFKAEFSVAQRTRALFNIISRPPLLCAPSFGIKLPFESNDKLKTSGLEKASKELRDLALADPCLLSMDGLLDAMFVARNAIEYIYDEYETRQIKCGSETLDSTLNVLDFFLNRIDPVVRKLSTLRMSLNDFELGQVIGRGACGVVRVVQEKTPPHSVFAMKSQYKGSWLYHDPEGSQLLLERTVLAQATIIDNPWLPHLYYAFQDDQQLHLVMDYEPGGDMYIFLTKAAHLLDSEMIQFYGAEIVEAVHSLHQMGYIHCDIKPENFAIERSGHLKLIDFGSAIRLDSNGECICPTMVGTKEYLSIELMNQRKRGSKDPLRVGPGYDYWAIGVFLYELFYNQTPFFDEDDDKMMKNIINYKTTLRFPNNVDVPETAKDLIRKLICDPSERLTYEGIVAHPFFQDVDFATIREHTPPYLPPVGKIDDVGNFSGGGARVRDEALHDITNDVTLSPSRAAAHNQSNGTPSKVRRLSNLENLDPSETVEQTQPQHQPLSSKEKQLRAIAEAAAVEIVEEVQEVEDIAWPGPAYAADLPFIGFSFTPTMLLGDPQSRQKQLKALIDNNTTVIQSRLSILENSDIGEEATAKIMEVKRRNRYLEKHITMQEEEIRNLRAKLQSSVYKTGVINNLDKAFINDLHQQAETIKTEITQLEASANALTLEKVKLMEELNNIRKCLLDFNKIKEFMTEMDKKSYDEAQAFQTALVQANENNRILTEEFTQVRQQLDRLRNANTKLVAERDAAIARAAKAEETAAAQADEAEAARSAMNQEVIRLTTTTEQQGKLINHLLSLLPAPERKHLVSVSSDVDALAEALEAVAIESNARRPPRQAIRAGGFVRSRNGFWGGRNKASSTAATTGHFALFPKNKSMVKSKKNTLKSSLVLGNGYEDVKRNTAFKSMIGLGASSKPQQRRSVHVVDDSASNAGNEQQHQPGPPTSKLQQPAQLQRVHKRRMVAWMRNLSTLRSRHFHGNKEDNSTRGKSRHRASADLAGFSEDEGEYDLAGGVYMGDNASLDFPNQEGEFGAVSDVDYMRASVSTASSGRSPSLQSYPEIATRTAIWSQHLQASNSNTATTSTQKTKDGKESHTKLFKQFSRVLGKGGKSRGPTGSEQS
nr:citron Rho interacting kinase [Hymenolepis microstoma]